jgi:hypothetical protein
MTINHQWDCGVLTKKTVYTDVTEYMEIFIKMAEAKTESKESFILFFYSSLTIFGNLFRNFQKNDSRQLEVLKNVLSPFTRHIPLNIPNTVTENILRESLLSFLYLCIKSVVLMMPRRNKFVNATREVMDQFLGIMAKDSYKMILRDTKITEKIQRKLKSIFSSEHHDKDFLTVDDVRQKIDIKSFCQWIGYSETPTATYQEKGNVIVTIFGAYMLDLPSNQLKIGSFPIPSFVTPPQNEDRDSALSKEDGKEEKEESPSKKPRFAL